MKIISQMIELRKLKMKKMKEEIYNRKSLSNKKLKILNQQIKIKMQLKKNIKKTKFNTKNKINKNQNKKMKKVINSNYLSLKI